MSLSPITAYTRAATRKDGEPLNILTFPTHEAYETGLAKTGHNFYAYRADNIKNWETKYRPVPDNYTLLPKDTLPLHVDLDLVLSQNKFGQFQIAYQIAKQLNLPLVSLEHTLPFPGWSQQKKDALSNMRGDLNLFISEYSIGKWGFVKNNNVDIIRHCIDIDTFHPVEIYGDFEKDNHILSVVNDWINRDWCCGFSIWQRVTQGLPTKVVGDTDGLSKPAGSVAELVRFYQNAKIFLNTSTISPVPTALLEAMACGCAVVSTETCMIPEIIENGVNGFMTNDEDKMKEYLVQLLGDDGLCEELGKNARQTILDKCHPDRFIQDWNNAFQKVVYK